MLQNLKLDLFADKKNVIKKIEFSILASPILLVLFLDDTELNNRQVCTMKEKVCVSLRSINETWLSQCMCVNVGGGDGGVEGVFYGPEKNHNLNFHCAVPIFTKPQLGLFCRQKKCV